jgi:hypothetical protein
VKYLATFQNGGGRVCRVQKLEPFGVTEMCEVRREDLGEKLEEVEE